MNPILKVSVGLVLLALAACDKKCKNDGDCIFINDGQGGHYEEINVEDGVCDCA